MLSPCCSALSAGGLHFIFIAFYLYIWGINLVAGFSTFSAIMVVLELHAQAPCG